MQQAPITASVVIVTYNRPDHVQTCLEHLSHQTLSPQEIIVVDASPELRTAEVVDQFPGITYLRNDLGMGHMATSRSIGIARATGDVVAFIDDDAYAEPGWLAALVERYRDARVGAVGGSARNGQPGEESEGVDQIGRLLPDGRLTGYFAADPGHDVEVDHLLGANMSFRREVVEEIGGIHDHYPGTCLREDADTALRVRRSGYRVVFTPDAVVLHVGGTYAKGRRFDARYQYFGARNHVVLLTHTLGFSDPRTRRYLRSVGPTILRELGSAGTAFRDPDRRTLTSKVRGTAGALVRAGAFGVGTVTGLVAAVRLAWEPTHRRRAEATPPPST